MVIELGVGITVAFVMVSLFYSFAGYRQKDLDDIAADEDEGESDQQ
jgi:hypothetical protein